jgi:flagellar basal-body rod protein FlgG
MIQALTTAATGMEAQQANIERISNDLANVNTDGYKRSRNEFQDLMYKTTKEAGGSIGAASQTPVGIQVGLGVKIGTVHKNFEEGPARITNNPYDVMIEGKGFFPVKMPNTGEVVYSRAGNFHIDSQGRFQLANGAQVIPEITIPSNALNIRISPSGEVKADLPNAGEATLGNLQLIDFQNEQGLDAMGDGLYRANLASGGPLQAVPGENGMGTLMQGALEGSNVNVANSMVEMISTQRAYEMGTKVMGTADKMWESTINIK